MIKKILALSLFSSLSAFAGEANLSLGFKSGAINIGGTYENSSADTAVGGYFLHQTEKDDAGVNAITAIGGLWRVTLVKKGRAYAYVSPGFGLALFTGIGNQDDKTLFGPSMKIGAQYYLSQTSRIGLERFLINNWFDDETLDAAEWTTLNYAFIF